MKKVEKRKLEVENAFGNEAACSVCFISCLPHFALYLVLVILLAPSMDEVASGVE